jgi:NAD(P)-dependent dehydrogenase (short-subunit alcohol dehydrogenase family)
MRMSKGIVTHKGKGGVLVTGASSGIGRAIAVRLAAAGWVVFGTVRREEDAEALRALGMPSLFPIRFDLRRLEDLPLLVETVHAELTRRGEPGLFALINNAGGSMVGPVELMSLWKFADELQARLVGAVALVQTFLPSLRRGQGRILWIATPGTIPTPYVTGIHASDFAVNCIARTLSIELGRSGPAVVLVRCGGIRTRAGLNTLQDLADGQAGAASDRLELYAKKLEKWGRSMSDFDKKRTDPALVAAVVEKALRAAKPRSRYRVGYMSGAAAFLELLPQGLVDRILAGRF